MLSLPLSAPAVAATPAEIPAPKAEIIATESAVDLFIDISGLFKNCYTSLSSKFVADVYSLDDQAGEVPDFSQRTSLKQICLNQLDITSRDFMEGFPGVDNLIEWFGLNININFKLKTKVTGNHLFALISDDGSILNIDGVDVILNDGRHGSVRQDATVNLAAGSHTVNIRSFRSPVCNRTGVENEDSWRCGRDLYFSRSDQPSVGLNAKKKAQGAMRLLGLLFRRG